MPEGKHFEHLRVQGSLTNRTLRKLNFFHISSLINSVFKVFIYKFETLYIIRERECFKKNF